MLLVSGHGHSGEGGDLVRVGAVTASGDGASQEIGVGSANFSLGGGKFEMALSEAPEKGSDVGDVVGGVGVEDNDVVKIRGDAFRAFGYLVADFDKPAGGGVAALRDQKVGLGCRTLLREWCSHRW